METVSKRIVPFLAVLCIIFFRFLPPPAGLTPLSMEIAGIFLGTIALWLSVSVTWPSLLCLFALIISPLYTYSEVYAASIGNWVTCFVLFSSALCYVLQKTGFLRRCAIWFITRPIARKNPWAFLALLFLAPVAIGSFMSPMTTFIIFVPIIEQIFIELGYEKGDAFPKMVTLSVLCFSSISSITTPIAHTMPILGMSLYTQFSDGKLIGFFPYTVAGVTCTGIAFLLIMALLKYGYKPDLSKIQNVDVEFLTKDMKPMSKEEKVTLSVFLAVVAIWMAPGIINGVMPKTAAFLNSLGTPTPPLIGIIILSLLKVDKKPIMNFAETFSRGVSWATMMLVAGTIILGAAVTKPDVGLTAWLGKLIAPLVNGLPTMACVLAITLLTVVITNFCSSTVTVTIVASIILPLTLSGAIPNINSAAIAVIIGMGACIAMATPPATAHAAIAAGTGWLDLGTMFKWGMLMSIIATLVLAFIGYPILSALL